MIPLSDRSGRSAGRALSIVESSPNLIQPTSGEGGSGAFPRSLERQVYVEKR